MNRRTGALCLVLLCVLADALAGLQGPSKQTGLLFDDVYLRHLAGVSHPERPERLTSIRDGLEKAGLMKSLLRLTPRRVTENELLLVHTRGYVDLVKRELTNLKGEAELTTGDTVISPGSLDTAPVGFSTLSMRS
jgi:acetoin utilization deacetylase AcuC-like enzyme